MLRLIATVLVVGVVYSAARPGSSTPAPGCAVTTPPSQPGGPYVGKPCPCSTDKIWLDVIVAIDNSASMGQNGLNQVKATLATVFGTITIGQKLRQQTRVALISYAKNAQIIANLTTYNDVNTFVNSMYTILPSDDMEVNLLDALAKADIVRNGVKKSETRQTVYVVAASAYDGEGTTDPAPYAKQIRESGAKILTYAFVRTGEGPDEVEKISSLASPGYAFTSDGGLASQLPFDIQQKFCDANCFCPNGWMQLADDFHKPTTHFAECLYLTSSSASWFSASMACPHLLNGVSAFLASEFTPGKHQFNTDYVANTTGTVQPYFIGLSWDSASGRYVWSEKNPDGTQIPLDPKGYKPWAKGSGNHVLSGLDGVQVKKTGFIAYWNDINKFAVSGYYMCQVNACDTDNYCVDSIDSD